MKIRTGRNAFACLIAGGVVALIGGAYLTAAVSWGSYVLVAGGIIMCLAVPVGFGSPWK